MGFLGQQYVLPQQQMQQPAVPQMTGPQDQAQAFNEGLLGMDEEVSGYYQDYGAVQNFAHDMWQNYGIDVTAPDPTNPASIDAYKMYLQGMAQVQERGNRMRQRQQLFNAAYARSLADPNIRFADGMTPETFDVNQVRNLKPTTMAEKIGERYARGVKSKEEEAQLEKYRLNALSMLEDDLANATDPRNRAEIEADIQYVKSLKPTYDPTFDKELGLKAQQAASKRNIHVTSRWEEINRIQSGDKGFWEGLIGNDGKQIFNDVIYDRSRGQVHLVPASGVKPIVIDLTSEDGGARTINEILNNLVTGTDAVVNLDELKGYGRSNKIELGLPESEKIKIDKYDQTAINNFQKHLTDGRSNLQAGAIEQLNEVASARDLRMPYDERGLTSARISEIEFVPRSRKKGDDLVLRFEVPDPNSAEGEVKMITREVTLDTANKKDQKFIDELLRINSDQIDYKRFSDENINLTRMYDPTNERQVLVDSAKVSEMRDRGFEIID